MSKLFGVVVGVVLLGACAGPGPLVRPVELGVVAKEGAVAWAADPAIASLREGLARRGLAPDVVDGPMASEGFRVEGPHAADRPNRRDCDCGAWLIATTAGRWWVYPSGLVEPADTRAWSAEREASTEDLP